MLHDRNSRDSDTALEDRRRDEVSVESLRELLDGCDLDTEAFGREIARLEIEHDDAVYAELLYLLAHLRFEGREAKHHWGQILEHRESMQRDLEAPVDLRVALVSYFVGVRRELRSPKVIELSVFEQTQSFVYRDELTGLYNYRFYKECLAREVERAERYHAPLSLVMVDVDDFKRYNDQNGHEQGSQALIAVARLLSQAIRDADVAVRYGGEEFALILPSTPKTGARVTAERARKRIEQHTFPGGQLQPGGRVSVSMGIATLPADATTAGELLERADSALYLAKASGKNQVRLYGQSSRSYGRFPAARSGRFRVVDGGEHRLTTVSVSEGGMLFVTNRALRPGAVIEVGLAASEDAEAFSAVARVVSSNERAAGRFETAIRIVDMEREDRKMLARLVRQLGAVASA